MGAACHACIGGTDLRAEISKLQAEAPHIVVGTPGRVYDMLSRGHLCKYDERSGSTKKHSQTVGWFYFTNKSLTFNATLLCSCKMYQDVCSGWSWWDVESRVQRSNLWDLPEAEHKHSSKNFLDTSTTPTWMKCLIWNPSALTELCYNCVVQTLFHTIMLAEYRVEGDYYPLHWKWDVVEPLS